MLARDLIGLLLHRRVEQEHAQHTHRENKTEACSKRRLTTSWCRRPRGHRSSTMTERDNEVCVPRRIAR